jgi:hypothetical protein
MLTNEKDILGHSTQAAIPETSPALRRQANSSTFEHRFCWVMVAVIFAVAALVCLVALMIARVR